MSPRSPRPAAADVVTAVLVSHDGARWLPECLSAISGQRRAPQHVVAVDTGSVDDSAALVAAALDADDVVRLPRDSSFAAAVQAGLDAVNGDSGGAARQWVWILHDDCAPEPDALAELLTTAGDSPSLAAVAPKVLSWDGRRLTEVGLTIDTSGRVHTGLESREVDQGQHDDNDDVLAAGTAGLLVRRDVWDRVGGLDPTWPLFGEDVDLGWRLNTAGERMRIAPRAIVRHAAALGAGARKPDAVSGRAGAVARRHGLQVVLANTAAPLVPLLVARYVVECLARAIALLLLSRRPAAALDEMRALGGLLARPGVVLQARRRRAARQVPHSQVRSMLAGPSLRWRLFGDRVAETLGGRAVVEQRSRRRAPVETGPVADESESMHLDDAGMLSRTVRRPGVLLVAALTLLGLVAGRHLLGGDLHGGRLLPPSAGASNLWSTYLSGWHAVGLGSATAAPPSLAVLAVLSSVLAGKVWLAVTVLMVGAVPLAGLSAYVASGAVTRSSWLRVWAAVVWAVIPALSGAVAGGRIDVVVTAVLLPLLARGVAAALVRQQFHVAVAAGVLLAVVTAFTPVVWLITAVVLLLVVAMERERLGRLRSAAVLLLVSAVLLVPWVGTLVQHPRLLVSGMGVPEQLSSRRPLAAAELLLMHPGGPAQPPLWVLAPLVAAAVVGLARARHHMVARAGFLVFIVGGAAALVASRITGVDPLDASIRYWTGAALAVAALGALLAAVVAGDRARPALRQHAFGWRQAGASVIALALLAGTATAAGALVVHGSARPLTGEQATVLPVFAAAEVGRGTSPKLVVLGRPGGSGGGGTGAGGAGAGGAGAPVRYALDRDPDGWRLGDADVAGSAVASPAARRLDAALRNAVAGQADAVPALAELGVSMLVVPDRDTAGLERLAGVDGLESVPAHQARA